MQVEADIFVVRRYLIEFGKFEFMIQHYKNSNVCQIYISTAAGSLTSSLKSLQVLSAQSRGTSNYWQLY